MNKWLYFSGGIVAGIVLTILVAFVYRSCDSRNGLVKYFEKPGDVIEVSSFKVFQVIDDNAALVWGPFHSAVYALTNKEGKYYYDDEIIEVPEGKVVRQIGLFRYETQDKTEKTVPIIRIMDE